ncbi:MAG: TIGR04168 family protein [Planctomycetes bacterium]|nr:TIGR04168 family protein [Planctomycetota bacterium]
MDHLDRAACFRILVVGDVHGHWTDADARYVEEGDQDLLLFVGDLADEDPALVQEISELDCELAVMLGNHDAWQSFSTKRVTPQLRRILELLGDDHLAYGLRELPGAGVTLLGARPFSWGGRDLRSPEIYTELYGVATMEDSAARLLELASHAQHRDLVVLAHNGPRGLGSRPGDIYGKDFGRNPGGDWGDRDLAWALRDVRSTGRHVRAVIAGHMHDRLFTPRGAQRRRFATRGGTAHLNAAVVPRRRTTPSGAALGCFLEVWLRAGELVGCREIWVDEDGVIARTAEPELLDLDARGDAAEAVSETG